MLFKQAGVWQTRLRVGGRNYQRSLRTSKWADAQAREVELIENAKQSKEHQQFMKHKPAMTFAQIARILGTSPQAVDQAYRRGIRKLRGNVQALDVLKALVQSQDREAARREKGLLYAEE